MRIFNRYTLWIILVSATLTVMAGAIIAPVLNLMREGLGVDTASVGFIITTHALLIAFFSPVFGVIIDKIGTKKPFIFGLVLYGLAGGSGLFISSYWLLIASRAVLGIAVAAILNSITVMILNLYEGVERDKIMGWRGSAQSFGGLVWPLVGGLLGGISWNLPFAVYFLGIFLAVVTLVTVPETRREETSASARGGSVLRILRDKPILFVIYGLMFLTMALLYVIVIFIPPLLEEFGITNPFHISLFIATMATSAGSTSLLYGRIRSRLSYRMIVLIALTLWAIGFTLISQAFSPYFIAASIVLFGIGQGMIGPAVMIWVGEMGHISIRGRIVSYLGTFGVIGMFLSPVIFGPIALILGVRGVFLVAGAVCALLFLLALAGLRNNPERAAEFEMQKANKGNHI
ncbi:MAG: MFS transporter [Thermoplasmata archaeon]